VLLSASEAAFSAAAFSPNGRWLAAVEDRFLHLWDMEKLNFRESYQMAHRKLDGHTDVIKSLAFSDDSSHLASGGNDRVVFVWM
jgi:WD40 repeat protein